MYRSGFQRSISAQRTVFLQNRDAIGGLERRHYKGTLVPRIDRAQRILVTLNGFVAVDGDQQAIAARLRVAQVVRMAGMHHIERAASESDSASSAALGLDPGIDLRRGAYLICDGHQRGVASNRADSSAPAAAAGNCI